MNVGEIYGAWSVGNVATAQETSAGTGRALAVVAKDGETCGALLVGVDQYASKSITPLSYACSDVRKIGDALIEIDFPAKNIRTLVGDGPVGDRPTRAVILAALDELLAKSGPNSTVFVVFSGHGFETPDGRSAFCPEDVEIESAADGGPTAKAASAILLEDVAKRLRQDDARFKLFIVDACRESASVSRDASATPRSFASVDASGLAFLQSCGSSEVSWEHPELGGGVFSAFFTEGLRGAADLDGDGGVTFWEVCERASRETQRFTKKECATAQTQFYTFSGVSDFYLTPPRSGRGGSGAATGGSGWLPFALPTLIGAFAAFAYWTERKRRRTAEALAAATSGATVAPLEAELARRRVLEAELARLRQEKEAALAEANAAKVKVREEASQAETAKKINETATLAAKVATRGAERGRGEPANAPNVEPKAGTRKTFLVNGVELAFRYCPAGTFWTGGSAGETRRKATLTRGFWTLETPVTQGMFEAATGSNPSYFSSTGRGRGSVNGLETSNFPVESVSWNDCVAFVKSLNDGGYLQDGFEFRLPTEVEWEYAARAGAETSFPWGEALNGDRANCNGTFPYGTNAKGPYWRRTTAVRSYPPNAWGLYDVVGNVWEQCADDGETLEHGDEKKAPTGYKRVLRGGSWLNYPQNCRIACRK